jgi:parallel beta-helix repeat protein
VTCRGLAVLWFFGLLGCVSSARGEGRTGAVGPVLYVDPQITEDTRTYDPLTRKATGGTARALPTLAGAAAAATPGTAVLVRAGRYDEPLVPRSSGAPGQPIHFKGFPGETAVISGEGLDPAVDLSGRSHIVIEDLQVTNVVAWVRAKNAHHNAIRGCSFTRALAHGSRAGIKLIDATHNRIEGNLIQGGNDNLSLIHSDRNVVVGNTFRRARHNLWAILCGSFNVIRNNSFHNEQQKIGQVTDCEGAPSDTPRLKNSTRRNLVEGNTFAFTPSSGGASPYVGIQFGAQDGIVRRNAFFETVGPGFELSVYPEEALYVTGNRIFHNVFHGTRFAGVTVSPGSARAFAGNVFKNNVFSGSVFQRNDGRWRWYAALAGKPVQIMLGRRDGLLFERNLIYGGSTGEKYTVAFGRRDSDFNPGGRPLSEWQKREKKVFVGNLEADPVFRDAAGHDFRPGPGSPLVDQGAFLTTTSSAGRGTTLPVRDARYFFDGFGIAGEAGDTVRLEGGDSARVTHVDHEGNRLELDRPLTWTAGQGVSLDYTGRAPDIGAYETPP